MDAKTIEAIHKSINHWDLICQGVDNSTGPGPCALCQMFNDEGGCGECPLHKFERKQCTVLGRDTSFYGAYVNSISWDNNENFCNVDSAEAAEAMLEVLVGLLPGEDERTKYQCIVEPYHGNWCYQWKDMTNGATGITTDGRNRAPQAEEVWREVFKSQEFTKHAKSYHKVMFENPPNCPTCGQEVKAKEVRYRFVYRAGGEYHGLQISRDYYTSVDHYNKVHPTLKAVEAIKSTAKEFEV